MADLRQRIHNDTGAVWPINGWPLDNPRQTVATISGFWDSQPNTTRTNFPELLEKGGESVIAGIPTWTSLVVATPDGHAYTPGVPADQVLDYHQTLSLRDGIVTTSVKWQPVKGGLTYDLVYTVLAHRTRVNLGMVRCDITPSDSAEVIVTDILDGQGAQRTDFIDNMMETADDVIWTAVSPAGLPNVTAYEVSVLGFDVSDTHGLVIDSRQNGKLRSWVSSNASTISQDFTLEITGGRTVSVLKYVGIASSDAFPDTMETARNAALEAKDCGWDALVAEHRAAWDELWEDADIVIPGEEQKEMQIAIRATLFHLLSNIRSGNEENTALGDNSVAVGGLASDSYAGLVFWDADLWMLPGLLVLHPEYAAAINNYRFRLLPDAQANAREYDLPGALYPWTSGRFGNCTGTGPCVDYEYHINSDIALVQWHQFLTTGDEGWLRNRGWPIIRSVADMWAGLVKKSNASGDDGLEAGMYVITNMTDPDEYANHVDNGAFTSGGIKTVMGIARQAAAVLGDENIPAAKWADIEANMFIPYNSNAGIVTEFSNMNGSVQIKQADVVLLNYPLEYRFNATQALGDLDFYARAQSPDGPAMTWAIFAIDALELSPHGCASWTYSLYASQPYLRAPYYQFSEQIIDDIYVNGNTNPAFTFLTGHGGFLQISTHGYTGYRPRIDAFYLDPSIPPQLKDGITVRGMKHRGAAFDVHITLANTTITRRPASPSLPSNSTTIGNSSIPITVRIAAQNPSGGGDFSLLPGESLVVPTRRPDLNGTDIPGNAAQCARAVSANDFVPGQFPLAAVDGSNHTNWQPRSPEPAELLVDLGQTTQIRTLSLNWAKFPPLKWQVWAANFSVEMQAGVRRPQGGKDDEWTLLHSATEVKLSEPWDEKTALEVRRVIGNTTVVRLPDRHAARFVKLVVEGDRAGDGMGPTVAQFAVLAE